MSHYLYLLKIINSCKTNEHFNNFKKWFYNSTVQSKANLSNEEYYDLLDQIKKFELKFNMCFVFSK